MKTRIKLAVLTIAMIACFAAPASAQKVSAAIIEQHYATQASTYKAIMLLLTVLYTVYLVLRYRHRRQLSRYMGKA